MLASIVAVPARHRRPVLAIVAAVVGGYLGLVLETKSHTGQAALGLALSVVLLACAVVGLVAELQRKPARFTVDERAGLFGVPPHSGQVWFAITGMLMCAVQVLGFATDWRANDQTARFGPVWWIGGAVVIGTVVVLVAAYVIWVWAGTGLRLSRDVLVDRTPLGSLTVAWQALTPGPAPLLVGAWVGTVTMTVARPELVHRRGIVFSRRRIQATGIDPAFLDAAIRYYIAHPERRSGIGTPEGHQELLCCVGVQPRA